MRYQNKIVLVIGGNSGIGLATARAYAAEGAQVIITGRNAETLNEASASIVGSVAYAADVADLKRMVEVYEDISEKYGRIDILFMNAGIGAFCPALGVTEDLWDQVFGVNLRGAFFAMQRAVPLIPNGGSIVATGSLASERHPPYGLVYSATKSALRTVIRVLARELPDRGIRVNLVSPGPIETPIIDRNLGMEGQDTSKFREMLPSVVALGRVGEPEEVARVVLFLTSSDASFVTGQEWFVDGGANTMV